MAKKTAEELKKVFADGERPTGDDFSDLIDSTHGGGTETTIVPVSEQIAQAGTNSTGFVSPAGVKAYVEGQKATKGEAEAGTSHGKLMTPLRTKEALTAQVSPLLTTFKSSVLGGISATYNTLKKVFDYVNSTFYTRSQSDTRYERKGTAQGGVATTYNTLKKLLTYLNNTFYTRSQSDTRYERKGTVQGGVSTTYNTLQKLLAHLNSKFYTKTNIDSAFARYTAKTDTFMTEQYLGEIPAFGTSWIRATTSNTNARTLRGQSSSFLYNCNGYKMIILYPAVTHANSPDHPISYDLTTRFRSGLGHAFEVRHSILVTRNGGSNPLSFTVQLNWSMRILSTNQNNPSSQIFTYLVYERLTSENRGNAALTRSSFNFPAGNTASTSTKVAQYVMIIGYLSGSGFTSIETDGLFASRHNGKELFQIETVTNSNIADALLEQLPAKRDGTGKNLKNQTVFFRKIDKINPDIVRY